LKAIFSLRLVVVWGPFNSNYRPIRYNNGLVRGGVWLLKAIFSLRLVVVWGPFNSNYRPIRYNNGLVRGGVWLLDSPEMWVMPTCPINYIGKIIYFNPNQLNQRIAD